jgi:hypothetical protein
MMGSSVKLMGLATLNILLALALAAAYLGQMSGTRLQAMTEEDVRIFSYDISKVTAGKRVGFDSSAVTKYFMSHIADDGVFNSILKSDIPGIKPRNASLDKKAYISDLLQDMRNKGVHDISMKVEDIKISNNGRLATAQITRRESASIQMAAKKDEEADVIPIVEMSRCKQTFSLSNNHLIQLQEADCATSIERIKSD